MTSDDLRGLADACRMRALNASPVFLRALAECLRQHAEAVAALEAAVLGHVATADRRGANVVPLPARRGTGDDAA